MPNSLLPHQPPQAADEASARELLELAAGALRSRRLAEVEEIRLAIQWAVVSGHPRDVRDPMVSPGGDGTPPVREHAIPELAMSRETHPATARALIADGLDLAHRLPLTWAVVEAGDCEPWVGRKVAVISRALLSEQVDRVDRAVAKAIGRHAPSTVLEIARAKVIEADPETHRAERERSRHERYVRLSRADEFGYRHVIARVTAGDAAWIDAMADTVDRLCSLPARKLAMLRGRGRLFVHLTDDALRTGRGVARIEGVGPIDIRQLHEVLGDADVTLTPVLDLRMRRRVDAYEHPEVVKDHAWVQTGGDCFPWTPRTATRDGVDYDHAIPYDDTGPPGQTGPHNSGPLRRSHHRTKTHGGLVARVVGPGRHLWLTSHGQAFLVDHTGTTKLTEQQGRAMAEAIEDGVELYFT